jgi:glycogen debranching enzyme
LLADDMFSGWGIRTLSANERRYNPLSYHNGSVWPHDNAIAAAGLARAGCHSGVHQVLDAMVQAASQLGSGSLPELFCGLGREPELGPVPYPVACHPQAWSAASAFSIVSSMLGLRIAGFEGRVKVDSPSLLEWLDWIRIDDLNVGGESISLRFERAHHAVGIEVIEKRGSSIGVDFPN